MPCRAVSRSPAGSTSCAAPARSSSIGGTNFDTGASVEMLDDRRAARSACRCSIRCSTAALEALARGRCAAHGVALALLRHASPAASCASAGSGGAEPAAAVREPLAHQVQADHRRFRRLGPVPGAAADARTRSRQRHGSRHRHRGERRRCSTGRASRPSSSARATGSHLAANLRSPACSDSTRGSHRAIEAVLAKARDARAATVYALERDRTGRHGSHHEVQSERRTASPRERRRVAHVQTTPGDRTTG